MKTLREILLSAIGHASTLMAGDKVFDTTEALKIAEYLEVEIRGYFVSPKFPNESSEIRYWKDKYIEARQSGFAEGMKKPKKFKRRTKKEFLKDLDKEFKKLSYIKDDEFRFMIASIKSMDWREVAHLCQ